MDKHIQMNILMEMIGKKAFFEWRGNETPQDGKRNWFNPKTGESLSPDINQPKPILPHWDYKQTRNGPTYRWYLNGNLELK